MAIRSAKDMIRSARLQSGFTQDELADGICSRQALSRIECGSTNVSPTTFQALMSRTGFSHTRFPVFADRKDFECFRALKYARTHLDAWQLAPARAELQKLKTFHWADNRFYYQEWLFLCCRLQFRSYRCNHQKINVTLSDALRITRPDFTPGLPVNGTLTLNELEILTALAQEFLYLGDRDACVRILDGIASCSCDIPLSSAEKTRLQAETAIVRVKYLFSISEFEAAFQLADQHRHQLVLFMESAPLGELTFLTGLSGFHSGHVDRAVSLIKSAYYTALHAESSYACACLTYLQQKTTFPVTKQMLRLSDLSLKAYPEEVFDPSLPFLSRTGQAVGKSGYTIGDLIRDFRMEQGLSQQTLCYGLCSKSKLSKIEAKTLQPDIALTGALLQRLGISEQIFTFWGNEREVEFHRLESSAMQVRSLKQRDLILQKIERMEALSEEKDLLWLQECLASKAALYSGQKALALLMEALHLTLPSFDIHQILTLRLTRQELSILNTIACLYRDSGESYKSSLYFLQLLEYQKNIPLDIRIRTAVFPVTNYMHCHSLYHRKHFREVTALPQLTDLSTMRYNSTALMLFLFYYCQAFAKCQQEEDAARYAVFACHAAFINEYAQTASLLRRRLLYDFDITITD